MSRIACLIVCGTLIAGPASAASVSLTSKGLLLPAVHDLVVNVVNTCRGEATYVVTFRDASTGEQLKQTKGIIAVNRGTTASYRSARARNIVIAGVAVTCDGSVVPQPLVSVFLRDSETGIPRLSGEVVELR